MEEKLNLILKALLLGLQLRHGSTPEVEALEKEIDEELKPIVAHVLQPGPVVMQEPVQIKLPPLPEIIGNTDRTDDGPNKQVHRGWPKGKPRK